jgi:hypothetical protein
VLIVAVARTWTEQLGPELHWAEAARAAIMSRAIVVEITERSRIIQRIDTGDAVGHGQSVAVPDLFCCVLRDHGAVRV